MNKTFEGSLIGRTIDSESMNCGSSPRPQANLGSSSGRTSGFDPEKHSSNLCPRTNIGITYSQKA